MLHRDEATQEGDVVRRFYPLKLHFDRLITFPAALTLRHTIDEHSPLHGVTPKLLESSETRLMASVVCVETVIPAAVQSQQGYSWRDVRFGERFVEIYTELGTNRLSVDYGRIHETEPVTEFPTTDQAAPAPASNRISDEAGLPHSPRGGHYLREGAAHFVFEKRSPAER